MTTIIRPVCRYRYTAIPNDLVTDKRLSIETRGMLVYLLTRPPRWQVKLVPLMKQLSHEGAPVGRRKLERMIEEAVAAGYWVRSAHQGHAKDGTFSSYTYVVGMPKDVQDEMDRLGDAFQPHWRNAHTRDAHTHDAHAHNSNAIHKVKNLENKDSTNLPLSPSKPRHITPAVSRTRYTEFGRAALAADQRFVWEKSDPYQAWLRYRGANGIPIHDEIVMSDGVRRRGVWMPSLYPPQTGRPSSGDEVE